MAFVVETGTGLPDANAYISVAQADSYHADRGNAAWTSTPTLKEQAIVRATDYIDTVWGPRFLGCQLRPEQALAFPRDLWGEELPAPLLKATAEYALRALSGPLLPDPDVSATGGLVVGRREKVGPIEEETSYSQIVGLQLIHPYPAADMLLRSLVRATGQAVRN